MGGIVRDYTFESLKRVNNSDSFVSCFVTRKIKSSVYIYHNFIVQWTDFMRLVTPDGCVDGK